MAIWLTFSACALYFAQAISRHRSQDADRIPAPKLLETDQGTSQSRFMLAKLNPSATHNTAAYTKEGDLIFTDDLNLDSFMERLARLTVGLTR